MRPILFALIPVLLLTGCVTSGTYEKLQAEQKATLAERDALNEKLRETAKASEALEQELGTTAQSKDELAKKSEVLAQEKEALSKQKDQAEMDKAALAAQKQKLEADNQALSAEKNALLPEKAAAKAQYDSLLNKLQGEVQEGQLKITQFKNMLTVDVAEKIFFDSGKAALKPQGREVLKKVAEALAQYPDKLVRVIGHTDNVPLSKNAPFAGNWELSVARATNVVRTLQDAGLPASRLVAAGRGESAPVADNGTPEGRQKNRRIEIAVLDANLASAIGESVVVSPTAQAAPAGLTPTAK